MDMIDALTEARNTFILVHDGDAAQYEQECSARIYPERMDFLLGRIVRDALVVEAIDKAIDFIESRSLLDKAATLRYKALEMANGKIVTLESELAKLKFVRDADAGIINGNIKGE